MSPQARPQSGTIFAMNLTKSPTVILKRETDKGYHRASSAPMNAPDHEPTKCAARRSIFASFWDRSPHGEPANHPILSERFSSESLSERDSLPAPLKRLQKHTGVYPLNVPKSILREPHDVPSLVHHSDSTDCSSTESSSMQRTVHFDPRVTVTELADTIHREWYTERELEVFKNDTIAISRSYLIQNPALIPAYSQPLYDPVTKTWRKKALFSLPVLNSEVSAPLAAPAVPNPIPFASLAPTRSVRRLCCIKRILIVVPNETISDLLGRSIRNMVPDAEMDCVSCGRQALDRLQSGVYDMILASQRVGDMNVCQLFQRLDASNTLLISLTAKPPEGDLRTVADLCWSIPPPRMDGELLDRLHTKLVAKKQGQ